MVSIIPCILALDLLKSQRLVWRDSGYLGMKEPFCWIMYYLYYIYFWPCEGRNEGWHQLLLMEMSCLNQRFSLVCRNNCALSGLTIHATELEHVTLDRCYGGTAYSLSVCVLHLNLVQTGAAGLSHREGVGSKMCWSLPLYRHRGSSYRRGQQTRYLPATHSQKLQFGLAKLVKGIVSPKIIYYLEYRNYPVFENQLFWTPLKEWFTQKF